MYVASFKNEKTCYLYREDRKLERTSVRLVTEKVEEYFDRTNDDIDAGMIRSLEYPVGCGRYWKGSIAAQCTSEDFARHNCTRRGKRRIRRYITKREQTSWRWFWIDFAEKEYPRAMYAEVDVARDLLVAWRKKINKQKRKRIGEAETKSSVKKQKRATRRKKIVKSSERISALTKFKQIAENQIPGHILIQSTIPEVLTGLQTWKNVPHSVTLVHCSLQFILPGTQCIAYAGCVDHFLRGSSVRFSAIWLDFAAALTCDYTSCADFKQVLANLVHLHMTDNAVMLVTYRNGDGMGNIVLAVEEGLRKRPVTSRVTMHHFPGDVSFLLFHFARAQSA